MAVTPYDIYHNGQYYDRDGNPVISRAVISGTRGNGNTLKVSPSGNVTFGDLQWWVFRNATKTTEVVPGATNTTVTQTGLNPGDFYFPIIHDISIRNY